MVIIFKLIYYLSIDLLELQVTYLWSDSKCCSTDFNLSCEKATTMNHL